MSFPIGTHRVRPVDAVLGMTSTGKEQIGVMFEHLETFERITWYGYFTDATFERTIESLRYLGWTGNDLSEWNGGLPEGCANEVDIVVEDEQDQRDGTLRRKVRWINSGGGVSVKDRLSDDQARSFGARMKQKIAAAQAAAGVKPAAKPATRPAPAQRSPAASQDRFEGIPEDDIPF